MRSCKFMETILLQKSMCRLSLNNEQLVLTEPDATPYAYPLGCIKQILVYGNAQITTQAIKACLKEGIRIVYFSAYGHFLGRLEPCYPSNMKRRLKQYALVLNPERRLEWAKEFVAVKIRSELVELRRLFERKSFPEYKNLRKELQACREQVEIAADLPELLGFEGLAARTYYSAFSHFMPRGWVWNGRRRYPSPDRLNALLSFCYGKTAALFAELCETHGLDRQCGILHEPARYGGGLPYDLLEPFRAVFCDNLILKLVAKRTWKASDFQSAKNAVNLRPETMDSFEKEFEHALTLCYSRQYNSIRELMKRFAELIYQGIEQESDRPDLGSFLPAR